MRILIATMRETSVALDWLVDGRVDPDCELERKVIRSI